MESKDSELLLEEIMSLERERRDLLQSLTPTLSRWEQIHSEPSQATTTRSPCKTKSSQAAATISSSPAEDLLGCIVEDVEELGQRMLSMAAAYVLDDQSGAPPVSYSSYKAQELVSRASALRLVSEEFYHDTKNNTTDDDKQKKEPEGGGFLSLCRDYLQFPDSYKNELALNLVEEEKRDEEKEKKRREEEEREEEKEKEQEEREDEDEDYESTMEFLQSLMDFHREDFDLHRACWERVWGGDTGRRGGFQDTTTLSSMQFTHYTRDTIPSFALTAGSALEIYSIKVIKLKGKLNWPLKVYGTVAARDTVDRNRNILFSRSRRNYQLLTEKDPFLRLTGPSRAVVALDPVDFEVELEINEGASMSLHKSYYAKGSTSLFFHNPNCVVELSVGRLATAVQATIVGARVVQGEWPFKHGCRVACSSSSAAAAGEAMDPAPREVVLLDYHGKLMRVGSDGYLHLSRNVVSVELQGRLKVGIHAYSESGRPAHVGHVDFPSQQCQTRKGECFLGKSKVEIVVAWSLLPKDKLDLFVDCAP